MKTAYLCMLLLSWKARVCNMCELSNITIALESDGCGLCIYVNATWCSGYCLTKDPVFKHPLVSSAQEICTFKELVYETVKIPGCADHAESFYTYPVATGCQCGTCNTDNTDCTVQSLGPSYCSFSRKKE
ncbi:follitropin subunit beta [Microcaecilia unicolor]|uniref:Follitropin subunit beta n=1 Tax=Microcaecilia unicolor TaxID=1415580 RepID=A0A6P7XXX6_9AMPH|nr:follitropin subunit beta [Microcaecilia unicolor]